MKKKIALKNLQKSKRGNKDLFLSRYSTYISAVISFVMLVSGILTDAYFHLGFFEGWIRVLWYAVAYLPVGWPVVKKGLESIRNGNFFTEFLLMSIATIGAFAIGEYPEGVAVMLFYTVGELFQYAAVGRAKTNIKALLDIRPEVASVWNGTKYVRVHPQEVKIGEKIQVKSGEKVPLDGKLLSEKAELNTAALTGESKPMILRKGDKVLSGAINLNGLIEVETIKTFRDSSVARIIDLVQNASARKSKTELFIRKFARIYTPIVVFLAVALTFLPYFFLENYVFEEWLYRALIFLVVSCPCALVISIPLGYFGGLGASSRNGILFKGASFLDEITKINTLVMDKTGTVTKGVFKVHQIETRGIEKEEFLKYLVSLEKKSTHPIAKAIVGYRPEGAHLEVGDVREISGKGLKGIVNNKTVLAGNTKLMEDNEISFPEEITHVVDSVVIVSMDSKYMGYVTVADELKENVAKSISELKRTGIDEIIMLSGDKDAITQDVARKMGISTAVGGLLPADKLEYVEKLKKDPKRKVAFVGDGINDAPVLAVSDVGIAMGALGSDIAIETADVVIQTDQPSKIFTAIKIGKATRNIVWQNIALAFGVKAVVLLLGAWGLATMWGAVFADVGVAFLAILNAIRLQRMNW